MINPMFKIPIIHSHIDYYTNFVNTKMLSKIFGHKKSNNVPMIPTKARPGPTRSSKVERQSRALKIIHSGGHAESYYMAVPAATIIEKYPSFILARPDIFRRPWDSIVRREDILVPGQKYYLVPRRTVKKLRRRIKKPEPGFSFESKSFGENAYQHKDSLSSISGILVKPGPKVKNQNLHVRFLDIETEKRSGNKDVTGSKEKVMMSNKLDGKKRPARNENAWEASLQSVVE